jgi:ATP-dependent exoDNAse (exonuclease V) alpha subunit
MSDYDYRNEVADRGNTRMLSSIDCSGDPVQFCVKIVRGQRFAVCSHLTSLGLSETMVYKVGAKVMLLKTLPATSAVDSYPHGKLTKGLLGVVKAFAEGGVVVVFKTGGVEVTANVRPVTFETDGSRQLSICQQVPLKLCWYLTVHRAMAAGFDAISVHLDSMWGNNMLYTALSRATKVEGVTFFMETQDVMKNRVELTSMIQKVSKTMVEFDKSVQ